MTKKIFYNLEYVIIFLFAVVMMAALLGASHEQSQAGRYQMAITDSGSIYCIDTATAEVYYADINSWANDAGGRNLWRKYVEPLGYAPPPPTPHPEFVRVKDGRVLKWGDFIRLRMQGEVEAVEDEQ